MSEEVRDDGLEQTVSFVIQGKLANGVPLPPAEVAAKNFPGLTWIAEHWGAKALVFAGHAVKDHARVAIQTRNPEPARRTVYLDLGWREIDGRWHYLHAGGAIGEEGNKTTIEVAPGDGRLSGYRLPDPPNDPRLAIRASLGLTELAAERIVYPLLASIYRAPLCSIVPADFALFLTGPTGTFKTELTAIAQSHWGASFNGRNLPANWAGTGNALEKQAFLAKDAILTVDDFSPTGTQSDVARQHRDAERLLRAQGNRAGRARMRPDSSLRPEYYPRGIVLASGEDAPGGHSLRARVLFLEVLQRDVDLAVLTEAQRLAASGTYAEALSSYLRWLAPRMAQLSPALQTKKFELRAEAAAAAHRRTPDQVASLALGFDMFLTFATDVGAITDAERAYFWERCWRALGEAAAMQATYQASEDPVTRFVELVSAALATQKAHVASLECSYGAPDKPSAWGWHVKTTPHGEEVTSSKRLIGWLADDELLLEPEAAYAAVQQFAREQGDNIAMKQRTLWKRMSERGLLGATDPGRHTVKRMAGGVRRRVVPLLTACLSLPESGQSGQEDRSGDENAKTRAPIISRSGAFPEKSGQRIGALAEAAPVAGPPRPDPESETGQQAVARAPSQTAHAPIAPIAPILDDKTRDIERSVPPHLADFTKRVLAGEFDGKPLSLGYADFEDVGRTARQHLKTVAEGKQGSHVYQAAANHLEKLAKVLEADRLQRAADHLKIDGSGLADAERRAMARYVR